MSSRVSSSRSCWGESGASRRESRVAQIPYSSWASTSGRSGLSSSRAARATSSSSTAGRWNTNSSTSSVWLSCRRSRPLASSASCSRRCTASSVPGAASRTARAIRSRATGASIAPSSSAATSDHHWSVASMLSCLACSTHRINASASGWASAETKALAQPLAEALIRCVEHARHDNIDATDQWWSDVAALLLGAIDAPVARDLIALAVRDAAPGTEEAVRRRLQDALEASGRDLRQLNQTLDVDEFVFHLPAVLLDELARAARDEDSPLRPLVDAQLLYGIWATLDSQRLAPLSPQQLRD